MKSLLSIILLASAIWSKPLNFSGFTELHIAFAITLLVVGFIAFMFACYPYRKKPVPRKRKISVGMTTVENKCQICKRIDRFRVPNGMFCDDQKRTFYTCTKCNKHSEIGMSLVSYIKRNGVAS